MVKFLIPAAVLAATTALAAPAAAQWAPGGYARGYNGYGYGNGNRLEARVFQLRQEIRQLDRQNILSPREAGRLDAEARNLAYRVRQLSFNGVNPRERFEVERQIARLEQRIRYEATDGNRRPGNGYGRGNNRGYGFGYGQQAVDRDRDGRDDRFEDDRGREHDRGGHRDHERGDRDDD